MSSTPTTKKPRPAKPSGRPAGSKTAQAPTVEGELTRCPRCGSTDRDRYLTRRELAHDGTRPDGRPYTHVVWRRCRCAGCGQMRDDKHFENRK